MRESSRVVEALVAEGVSRACGVPPAASMMKEDAD